MPAKQAHPLKHNATLAADGTVADCGWREGSAQSRNLRNRWTLRRERNLRITSGSRTLVGDLRFLSSRHIERTPTRRAQRSIRLGCSHRLCMKAKILPITVLLLGAHSTTAMIGCRSSGSDGAFNHWRDGIISQPASLVNKHAVGNVSVPNLPGK